MKWIFLFLVTNALAGVEQKQKVLLQSKSIQQLKKDLSELDKRDLLEKTCSLELELKKVPAHCYELAEFKKASGEKVSIASFDRACADNADRMHVIVKTTHLSKVCSALVSKRNQEIEYSRE